MSSKLLIAKKSVFVAAACVKSGEPIAQYLASAATSRKYLRRLRLVIEQNEARAHRATSPDVITHQTVSAAEADEVQQR